MKLGRRLVATVAGCAVAIGVAVWGVAAGGPPPANASDKVVFNVALLAAPDSLNPFTGITSESYEMWYLMYPTLTTPNESNLTSGPSLAESFSHSEDGLVWTFHLTPGVRWSDGVPLTASDVASEYDAIIHHGAQGVTWGSYLTGVTSVTAPNPTTVVLRMKHPNVMMPFLPMPIVPKHVWGGFDKSQVRSFANRSHVVGAGPFQLVSADPTLSTLIFDRNPTYFGPRPNIDQIVFTVYKEEDAAVQALKKGEVDFVENVQGLTIKELQGTPGITAHIGSSPSFDEIAFNTGSVDLKTGKPIGDPNPAVLDPAFRHALGFALNRQQIVTKVYQGLGTVGGPFVPNGSPLQWHPPPSIAYRFDLARAGDLLDAAGYTMGSDGHRDLPNGQPIGTLRLDARTDSPSSIGTMTYFKEWLADLGIDAEVDVMSGDKLTDVILQGTYDMFQWGWVLDPDPDSTLHYMTCGERGNWSDSWFCNAQYDRWYEQQHVDLNPATRQPILDKMQRLLYLQAPYLITVDGGTGEVYRSDRFTGFTGQPGPNGIYLYQFGPYNYVHAKPIAGGGTASFEAQEAHNRVAFLLVLCALVVLLLAGSYLVSLRRAKTADDRP